MVIHTKPNCGILEFVNDRLYTTITGQWGRVVLINVHVSIENKVNVVKD